jgi:hypothetical protein
LAKDPAIADLAQKSAGFRRSLAPSLLASLADLVPSMNCYYSNLIEGHNTHPVDIACPGISREQWAAPEVMQMVETVAFA